MVLNIAGGLGAQAGGSFTLAAGHTLSIAVGGSNGGGGGFFGTSGGSGQTGTSGQAGGNGVAGGGGSFLAVGATNAVLLAGVRSGNGSVVINAPDAPPATVPEPASLALLGVGLAGLIRRRRRG